MVKIVFSSALLLFVLLSCRNPYQEGEKVVLPIEPETIYEFPHNTLYQNFKVAPYGDNIALYQYKSVYNLYKQSLHADTDIILVSENCLLDMAIQNDPLLSPDCKKIAYFSTGILYILDIQTKIVVEIPLIFDSSGNLNWGNTSNFLIYRKNDSVLLIDLVKENTRYIAELTGSYFYSSTYSYNTDILYFSALIKDELMGVYTLSSANISESLDLEFHNIYILSVSNEGNYLCLKAQKTDSSRTMIYLYDINAGKLIGEFFHINPNFHRINSIIWSQDDRRILLGNQSRYWIIDMQTFSISFHSGIYSDVEQLAWDDQTDEVYSVYRQGMSTLTLYNYQTKISDEIYKSTPDASEGDILGWSADGKSLIFRKSYADFRRLIIDNRAELSILSEYIEGRSFRVNSYNDYLTVERGQFLEIYDIPTQQIILAHAMYDDISSHDWLDSSHILISTEEATTIWLFDGQDLILNRSFYFAIHDNIRCAPVNSIIRPVLGDYIAGYGINLQNEYPYLKIYLLYKNEEESIILPFMKPEQFEWTADGQSIIILNKNGNIASLHKNPIFYRQKYQ